MSDRWCLSWFAAVLLGACGPARQPDRRPGARTPLSATCDRLDDTRCLLPWPSSTYTVADASTPTGLRLAVQKASLPISDDTSSLDRDDGFSVVTPLAVGFPRTVDHTLDGTKNATAVRLLVAQPGSSLGQEVPLRLTVVLDDFTTPNQGMIVACPMLPLSYDTDYVAVVLDEVHADDGSKFAANHAVRVALALDDPNTNEEAALLAYHAPTRALLKQVGIDASHVLRVWDFTTRSAASVSGPLTAMRAAAVAAANAGQLAITVDSAMPVPDGSAMDVRGHVDGIPAYAAAMTGWLSIDASGTPSAVGTTTAPFRAVVPVGSGNYRVVIYGHGTGGSVDETTFDTEIVGAGAGKLSLQWNGWTDMDTVTTLTGFENILAGTDASTANLCQSLANEAALAALLPGALGDILAAPTVGGVANLAAGRRPDTTTPVYAGGSLGGTMGYVVALVDDNIRYAVLNVPGAGWTRFAYPSVLWKDLSLIFVNYSPIDQALALAITQNNWDAVDGGAWAALSTRSDTFFLEQESIGDPVLPNIGTELVAASSHAVQVAAVLDPITGVTPVPGSATQTAITQFHVPSTVTDALDIHGFAAKDTPAGVAARQQISAFIQSVWAGAPRIDVPRLCPNQSCDFSAQ
jgi:hypothetical protein